MELSLLPFISFAIITSITPGPNNLSSASFSMTLGYRASLQYMLGIVAGFFMMMFVCAYLSTSLLTRAPQLQEYLKYVGAIYILWLAFKTVQANYSQTVSSQGLATFSKGFFLQLVNPKAIVYGLTIYTTFLADINELYWLILSVSFLALITFACISVWALFGAVIQRYMQNQRVKLFINVLFALGLVYTALDIADVFAMF